MDHKTVESYILSLPGAMLDYPFGEGTAVYKVTGSEKSLSNAKMFALISEGKEPINLSLKCDPQLSEILREKYVTIMPGYHLNKKHWNTLILSGEIPWEEVQALIRHSFQLVSGTEVS
ncbi:MAG TPA: MmcQ/YjbR family DNA-binding protein [Candidatus Saccharimonadia bacterium]|nr:MmcQ/YjbR family DNA-binding protein [Candidatus Saccharimonadia bacterium]